MALISLDEVRVKEALDEFFPPSSLEKGRPSRSTSGNGYSAGSRAGHSADIGNPATGSGETRKIGRGN